MKDRTKRWVVQFYRDGRRGTVRLGEMNKRTAEDLRNRIEALVKFRAIGRPPDIEIVEWLDLMGDQLYSRLMAAGLVPERIRREPSTLRKVCEGFIQDRIKQNARPNSITNYRQAASKLYQRLGVDRDMSSITANEVDQWLTELRPKYAVATVSRLVKFCKQFYGIAKRKGLVNTSPFDHLKAGSMANPERVRFVSRHEIERVIKHCPDAEWRLIVAIARYGGIRFPSEIVDLKWSDIQWERNGSSFDQAKPHTTRGKASGLSRYSRS